MTRLPLTATLVFLVHVGSVVMMRASDKCQPSCHGHISGDLVEDPMNCTQYFVCIDKDEPSSHPVACQYPTGVFDPMQGKCVSGDTCVATCAPSRCVIRCESALDTIADPTNCNQYYVCDAAFDAVGPYTCPDSTPYFNGNECVEDKWQCCKTECTPFCYPGDVQILDPEDCRKYYICLQEGPPLESNHFTCPPEHTFQPSASICEPYAPCLNLCYDITTTSTTTTTTTPTTTTDCTSHITCTDKGNFPMCLSCNAGYFECGGVGEAGVPTLCDEGFLFNTEPSYPYCVQDSECPYMPPTFSLY